MIDLQVIIRDNPNRAYTYSELATLLKQNFPDDKRSVNIALAVYESGIASKISKLSDVDYSLYTDFIKQLTEEYGLTDDAAIEGVILWAKAYSVSVEQIKNSDVVIGTSSDYEIIEVDGGIVISKFRGFDEENMTVPNMIDGKRVVGIGKDAYAKCTVMTSVLIPDGIEFIGDGAFYNCERLTKVILPNTITQIGMISYNRNEGYPIGAFANCDIQEVNLPKRLQSIGISTFEDCRNLKSIKFPNELTEIGNRAFNDCESLDNIVLPPNLTKLGEYVFYGCKNLFHIEFPSSLKEIGRCAFEHCESLTEVVLNEGLERMGDNVFGNCINLKKALLPRSIINISGIGNDLFAITYYGDPFKNRFYENLIVYCYSGSYALEYARKKGYKIKNALEFK